MSSISNNFNKKRSKFRPNETYLFFGNHRDIAVGGVFHDLADLLLRVIAAVRRLVILARGVMVADERLPAHRSHSRQLGNNVKGILDFANCRNILLVNSSPTTYNVEDYRYTYLLSKDGHSNTQVVPLLTYNQK